MVTLVDVTDDEQRLFDAFDILAPEAKTDVLQRLAIAACFTVAARRCHAEAKPVPESPKTVTRAFLMRCMPNVPTGYVDDFGFEQRYLDHALPRIEWRCLSMVLGSTSQDAANAKDLAEALTECAMTIASDFCAPDFAEDGFVDAETALGFIEQWRENFTANLARAAAKTTG